MAQSFSRANEPAGSVRQIQIYLLKYDTKVDITNSEGNIIIINRSMDNKRVDGLTTCRGARSRSDPGKENGTKSFS